VISVQTIDPISGFQGPKPPEFQSKLTTWAGICDFGTSSGNAVGCADDRGVSFAARFRAAMPEISLREAKNPPEKRPTGRFDAPKTPESAIPANVPFKTDIL